MSAGKAKILSSALSLFAKDGFASTSTANIARQASVSEGLIFKHFKSKQNLLDTIYLEAQTRSTDLIAPIEAAQDPKDKLRLWIDLPFGIAKDQFDYWRLIFKVKWEERYPMQDHLGDLRKNLAVAFDELGYESPEQEAQLLIHLVEALATSILQKSRMDFESYHSFLLQKYQLES